jgi:adenylate cyclase
MSIIVKSKLRLRITISVIFTLLMLPFFIGFLAYSYQSNYLIYKKNAQELINRSNETTIKSLVDYLNPIVNATKVTAQIISQNPKLMYEEGVGQYLLLNLINNPDIVRYFISSIDGSYRLVQRASKTVLIGERMPPEGANFASWTINRQKDQNAPSVYMYMKAWGDNISSFSSPNKYDPRKRPFFQAVEKNFSAGDREQVVLEKPFFTTSARQAVIAVSAPIIVADKLFGVSTALVLGNTFSDFLYKNRVTKNTQILIIDDKNNVIISSNFDQGFVKENDAYVTRNALTLENTAIPAALKLQADTKQNQLEFSYEGNDYLASFQPFPQSFNKPWMVLTLSPLDDFLVDLKHANNRLILIFSIALLLIMVMTYFLSMAISKPLERLAVQIQKIMEFSSFQSSPVKSRISEISTLSTVIERLKSTISAFTSYVPRDLVNDLLSSGKDIELGGESRYLTILFSDLKDFSTLSEITPSRELLLRVSSYLELMTYAIKEEGGTIDKFIGDSVMAFWGAPLLNQNHAYHACVAAFKTKRRMVFLNEKLVAEEKPPLVVRIGIHSDAVLVGNIGSAERLSYTVMGDGVNIAARLEGINKEFNTDICISHSLFKEAGERLWVRPIDQITVKGRKGELIIYELMGVKDGDAETAPTEIEKELCIFTKKAFDLYMNGLYVEALVIYEDLVLRFDDGLAAVMVTKCRNKINPNLS